MKFGEYQLKPISASDTIPIRHQILRPNQSPKECEYDGDHLKGAFHLGAFSAEGLLVGIASVMPQTEVRFGQFQGELQHRLRGMAVLPGYRSVGLGRALLDACVAKSMSEDCEVFWCNARSVAVEFYTKAGFEKLPQQFELPDIGPHFVMFRRFAAKQ